MALPPTLRGVCRGFRESAVRGQELPVGGVRRRLCKVAGRARPAWWKGWFWIRGSGRRRCLPRQLSTWAPCLGWRQPWPAPERRCRAFAEGFRGFNERYRGFNEGYRGLNEGDQRFNKGCRRFWREILELALCRSVSFWFLFSLGLLLRCLCGAFLLQTSLSLSLSLLLTWCVFCGVFGLQPRVRRTIPRDPPFPALVRRR